MLCCALIALAGCSGEASLAPVATGEAAAGPTGHDIHVVVEDRASVTLAVLPDGASLPGVETQPVPFATIQYPDGSLQVAGADGSFDPVQSSYWRAHASLLDYDPDAAPYAIVSGAPGGLVPIATQLTGLPAVAGSAAPEALNAYVHLLGHLAGGREPVLGAIGVHPRRLVVRAGESAILEAVALNARGQLESVPAGIRWSRPSAGTIVPIPGTAAARYTAPATGSGVDSVVATLTQPGATGTYSASVAVSYVGAAGLDRVSGSLRTGAAAIAGNLAFYQAPALPGYVEGTYWFANAPHGAFDVTLPRFSRTTPLAQTAAPAGSAAAFAPALAPGGLRAYVVNSKALTGAAFEALPGAQPFVDLGVAAAPPVARDLRDAWFVPQTLSVPHPYDADSGLQPLLARPGVPETGTVATGSFANWRFAWTRAVDGRQALELVQADGSGQAGLLSAQVTPAGSDTFDFEMFRASRALALGTPLLAQQPGSLLTAGGSWKQSGSPGGAFRADVTSLDYTPSHQVAALYARSVTYERDSGGGASIAESAIDGSGLVLWTARGARSAYASAGAGTSEPVFRYSETVQRYERDTQSTGRTTDTFAVDGLTAGDGSGSVSYRDVATGVNAAYRVLPAASAQGRADAGTLAAGSARVLASFSIDRDDVVRATLGDGTTGGAASSIAFPL